MVLHKIFWFYSFFFNILSKNILRVFEKITAVLNINYDINKHNFQKMSLKCIVEILTRIYKRKKMPSLVEEFCLLSS